MKYSRDIMAAAGLGLAGYGMWMISPGASLTLIGLSVFAVAVTATVIKKLRG